MFKAILMIVPIQLAIVPLQGPAHRAPNLSGGWVLLSATTVGGRSSGRADAPEMSGQTQTTLTTVSGAAFNCGRECTIVHKGQMLMIDEALLGSDKTVAPTVTLHLDGRKISVVDSFNPQREIPVTAMWNGERLEIISSTGSRTVTQSVTLEAGELVVVTAFNRDAARPVTFRYRKK